MSKSHVLDGYRFAMRTQIRPEMDPNGHIRKYQNPWGQNGRHRRSNVQTPTPNVCSAFRRRTVSPFDPTDFDASPLLARGALVSRMAVVVALHGLAVACSAPPNAALRASFGGASDLIRSSEAFRRCHRPRKDLLLLLLDERFLVCDRKADQFRRIQKPFELRARNSAAFAVQFGHNNR